MQGFLFGFFLFSQVLWGADLRLDVKVAEVGVRAAGDDSSGIGLPVPMEEITELMN